VTLADDGERWETFEEFINNGERYVSKEGHRSDRFTFFNDVPSFGKTSAKHLEATG
jgi:hypothetical protein